MADDKELLPKTLHNQLKLITSKANEVDFQKFKGISNHGNYCFVISFIQLLFHCPDVIGYFRGQIDQKKSIRKITSGIVFKNL